MFKGKIYQVCHVVCFFIVIQFALVTSTKSSHNDDCAKIWSPKAVASRPSQCDAPISKINAKSFISNASVSLRSSLHYKFMVMQAINFSFKLVEAAHSKPGRTRVMGCQCECEYVGFCTHYLSPSSSRRTLCLKLFYLGKRMWDLLLISWQIQAR